MNTKEPEQKVTFRLEMTSIEQLQPSLRVAVAHELRQVEIPCPEFNWFLHQSVGNEFCWGGRESWGRKEWTEHVNRTGFETWVAYVSGTPAGYFEIERQPDGSVRIECFGLRRQFFGQGLGAALLTSAVQRCWQMGATLVWLTTCSHDHPHAVSNYQKRGFEVVAQFTGPPNKSRPSGLFTS